MGKSSSLNFFGVQGSKRGRFFHVHCYGDGQNFLLNQGGQPHFFFWTKTPPTTIRVERSCLDAWKEKFLAKLSNRPVSAYSDLLKKVLTPVLLGVARPRQDVAPLATTQGADPTFITTNEVSMATPASPTIKEALTSSRACTSKKRQ
ncbi:hypothetical protein CR513_62443, partial [Mucuna pruriens]